MTRKSGWCLQLGRPDHDGCRVPLECACSCHETAKNKAEPGRTVRETSAAVWENIPVVWPAKQAARPRRKTGPDQPITQLRT